MSIITDTLDSIASTSSRKEKEALLQEVAESKYADAFKKLFLACYDPRTDYYIKDFDYEVSEQEQSLMTLSDAIDSLYNLSNRIFTGNQARQWLTTQFQLLNAEDQSVLYRIIQRDLRCGISATTINKIFPNLIYQHPYMRCDALTEKTIKNIEFPCISQVKLDGLYCDIVVKDDTVTYMSRSGQDLKLNDKERDQILIDYQNWLGSGYVLQGEVLVLNEDSSIMERQSSNGYINSDDRDMSRVQFHVWDFIDIDSFEKWSTDVNYQDRFEQLGEFFDVNDLSGTNLFIVESREVESVDDIVKHFTEVRSEGLEGLIIKDYDGLWKNGTSKQQLKCKVIIDVDLRVVGYKPGEGKYEGQIGSLQLRSSDDLIEVFVGTGLKDKDRSEIMNVIDDWIEHGQIVKIKCNGIIKNNTGDVESIFLPRYIETRIDKTEADSYDDIKKSEDSFLDILKLIS
jgi:DNA ligase 1